jgi:putative ABC transport system permease protein
MVAGALTRKVFRDLRRMWVLALAIALVTAAGAAIYVLSIGTVRSLENTRDAYYDRYHFSHIFALMKRAPNTLKAEMAKIPGVQQVETRITYNITMELLNYTEPVNGLMTTMPAVNGLNLLHLREGRLLLPNETDTVVVSDVFAKSHKLHPGDTFNANIKGNLHKLKVVGTALSPEYLFFSVPGSMMPDNERFGVIWMSRKAMEAAFDYEGAFNDVALTVMRGASEKEIISRLDSLLAHYGASGAYSRQDHVSHATLTGQIEQLRKSTKIAAPVFLAIVAFMLHMMMKRHIATERELIGMMKAFGLSDADVAWHYSSLMLMVIGSGTSLGITLGSIGGKAATAFYALQFQFPFLEYHLSYDVLAQAVLIQLAAGALGTASSLRAAARIEPAVAMRPALPPVYRRTWLEKTLSELAPDQIVRIIIRNILRWPLRSTMNVLIVVGAMALVISPLAVMDSAAEMTRIHFFKAERQEMTVSFAYPRDLSSIYSLRAYPGMRQIEPFRMSPVRLRFGQRERRLAALGRAASTDLVHPIDGNYDPIDMPPFGIVISKSLANWLGAHVGDKVELSMLETDRVSTDVPIAAISESYIGMTFFCIFMDRHYLNHLLGEGDLMSGINFTLDWEQVDALYEKIKNTPSITAIISNAASLKTMRRMFGQQLRLTAVNYIFATVILIGVIYNVGRISLVERQRELATLIMLGVSRGEAAFIIVGELAILSLLALPLGCLVGYILSWELTEGSASDAFRIPLYVDPADYAYGIMAVMASMLVTGYGLYRYLSKLDLVEMIKTRE